MTRYKLFTRAAIPKVVLACSAVFTLASAAVVIAREYQQDVKACRMLDIALDEAQMAEGWYLEAGKVLKRCGIADAEDRAAWKACHARRFNNSSEVCE